MKRTLTLEEKQELKKLHETTDLTWEQKGEKFGITGENARSQYRHFVQSHSSGYSFNKIAESPYPKYDTPLEQEGDCLVIPDLEAPFHNADFVNRCIELAMAWGVRQVCLAGDAMHFNSISHWEANWKAESRAEIGDRAHAELFNYALQLPAKYQDDLLAVLDKFEPATDGDVGSEVEVASRVLYNISTAFDDVVYVMGNHDGRFLSALNSPLFASQLKSFIMGDNPKYRVAPYYYSTLHTEKGDYSIEHPTMSSEKAAVQIATQKQMHVLMGHSHRYSRLRDPSGKLWCIQMGMVVDESRLAYVGQRTRSREKHSIGATIVRGGYPYDLNPDIPWELWKRL